MVTRLFKRFAALKRVLRGIRKLLFPRLGVSSEFVNLKPVEINSESQRLSSSWQDESLPKKQRALVDQQLIQYRAGVPIPVFDVFVDSVQSLPDLMPGASLLEIGCSSGFYSEVIDIADLTVEYTGCDYSDAFIRLAREKYPTIAFDLEDATDLRYDDASFDIVVSGCCLLHIPEYRRSIAETARVAGKYVIFHRTPVVWGQPERWYRKLAYGVETIEIHFNEPEFLSLMESNGLDLVVTHTLSEEVAKGKPIKGRACRTYVCKKRSV